MGCDIHLHVEVRSRKYKDAKWRHADIDGAFSDRIYGMFYALAEVRGPYNGITPLKPKGIPDDMSWQTKDDISYVVDNEFAEDRGTVRWRRQWITLKVVGLNGLSIMVMVQNVLHVLIGIVSVGVLLKKWKMPLIRYLRIKKVNGLLIMNLRHGTHY